MFIGTDIQGLKDIRKRLEVELKDKDLPRQRKEEVLAYLYYINSCIREKEKGAFRK